MKTAGFKMEDGCWVYTELQPGGLYLTGEGKSWQEAYEDFQRKALIRGQWEKYFRKEPKQGLIDRFFRMARK